MIFDNINRKNKKVYRFDRIISKMRANRKSKMKMIVKSHIKGKRLKLKINVRANSR